MNLDHFPDYTSAPLARISEHMAVGERGRLEIIPLMLPECKKEEAPFHLVIKLVPEYYKGKNCLAFLPSIMGKTVFL